MPPDHDACSAPRQRTARIAAVMYACRLGGHGGRHCDRRSNLRGVEPRVISPGRTLWLRSPLRIRCPSMGSSRVPMEAQRQQDCMTWLTVGDTPSWANPAFTMARPSAEFFDEGVSRRGAVIAGRRTYDLSQAWGGRGPIPGCCCSSSLITFPTRCRPASGRTYSAIRVMLRAGSSGVADGEAGAVGDGRGLGAARGAELG